MKILIVDDERSIRLSLYMSIKKLGVEVDEADDGLVGIEKFKNSGYDIVLLDIKMPGLDGIEVLKQIRRIDKKCIVIMMTHLSEVRLAVKAMKAGASEYFTKPFSIEEMTEIVKESIQLFNDRNKQEETLTDDRKTMMIGHSKSVTELQNKIDKLSKIKTKTTILVHGESGTGKELVAKMISEQCASGKPYVAINCAAIPTNLQESEMFGHEKGAFSDAKEKRIGLFEQAKDGVLFLDEIGEMALDMQAKLLRVLQERQFRSIGGRTMIPFNAMVVAATNRDLQEEVAKGTFRKDLYYRLNIIPINVPPLRERKEDLQDLIDYFVQVYNKDFEKSVKGLSGELCKSFMEYDWPGNIRELKNIIERLMIFSDTDVLSSIELPYELSNAAQAISDLSDLERAEQETVLHALSEFGWNITKTAQSLGISRLTLRRKIDKYGLKK